MTAAHPLRPLVVLVALLLAGCTSPPETEPTTGATTPTSDAPSPAHPASEAEPDPLGAALAIGSALEATDLEAFPETNPLAYRNPFAEA